MITLDAREKVTLAFLTTVGAAVIDLGAAEDKKKQFEDKFGTTITTGSVTSVVKKMANLLAGSETIIID
jgi:hypothetical protein